uniref:Protein disulfide-isomerase n=1 Tax=Romanomermis culicivorax TaxID=13658 RepID=A0A915HJH9_ROMCU
MFVAGAFILVFLSTIHADDKPITAEDDVFILTENNFNRALENNDYLLVEFYAPWCGHCKALEPEYKKAAKMLKDKDSTIRLGKVDATAEQKLGEEHGVKGYPTLKFFRNKTPIDYTGGRQAEEIVAWLEKKSGPPAMDLATIDKAKEFIEKAGDVIVLACFKDQDSDKAKKYIKIASDVEDAKFAITSADKVCNEYKLEKDKIVLLKKFDEKRNDYEGDVEEKNLKKFIATYSLPLVNDFSQETAGKLFSGEIKSHVLMFAGKKMEDYEKLRENFKKAAEKFRGKLLYIVIDSDIEDNLRIMEYFGLKKEDVPSIRIIALTDDMIKYRPDFTELSSKNIIDFTQRYLDKKLKPHLLSEEIPEDWDKEPVKVLVSKNFEEVALDSKKNVFVEFCKNILCSLAYQFSTSDFFFTDAPWCGHCKQLAPVWEKLGEKYKDHADIIIAKIDGSANELESVKIKSFPTLKFFPAGADSKVIDYAGDRTLEGFTKFLETGGKEGGSPSEEKEDEEEEEKEEKKRDEL